MHLKMTTTTNCHHRNALCFELDFNCKQSSLYEGLFMMRKLRWDDEI